MLLTNCFVEGLKALVQRGYIPNIILSHNKSRLFVCIINKGYFMQDCNISEEYFYTVIKSVFKISESVYGVPPIEQMQKFFGLLQDKFLYAICGKTTAELIIQHANANSPDMGLKHRTVASVILSEAILGKNYLDDLEFSEHECLVRNFIGFCSLKVKQNKLMTFDELTFRLNSFLTFNGYEVLFNKDTQLEKQANLHVREEFMKYTSTKQ